MTNQTDATKLPTGATDTPIRESNEPELAAVLWDMDGTLIDSEPIWMDAQAQLVAEHGGSWTGDDALRLVGSDMDATAAALQSAGVPLSADEITARLSRDVMAVLEEAIEWRPGAADLVGALRDVGVRQAIVTTSPRFMARVVADALPFGTFDVIVTGDDVDRGKPHPTPYLLAAEHFGALPSHCVAIEDSTTGLASAIAAGTVAVGVEKDAPLTASPRWMRLTTLRGVTVADLRGFVSRARAR